MKPKYPNGSKWTESCLKLLMSSAELPLPRSTRRSPWRCPHGRQCWSPRCSLSQVQQDVGSNIDKESKRETQLWRYYEEIRTLVSLMYFSLALWTFHDVSFVDSCIFHLRFIGIPWNTKADRKQTLTYADPNTSALCGSSVAVCGGVL